MGMLMLSPSAGFQVMSPSAGFISRDVSVGLWVALLCENIEFSVRCGNRP